MRSWDVKMSDSVLALKELTAQTRDTHTIEELDGYGECLNNSRWESLGQGRKASRRRMGMRKGCSGGRTCSGRGRYRCR